jgi:hypothetical protein
VGQMRAGVSYTVPVMEVGRRALISHILTRKGHSCSESYAYHALVLWRTWVGACSFTVNFIPWCILHNQHSRTRIVNVYAPEFDI